MAFSKASRRKSLSRIYPVQRSATRDPELKEKKCILEAQHTSSKDDKITVAGDGQVTLDTTILKHGARKVRRLYNNEVIVGFAGATADAFTLFDRFDQKLEQYNGNLLRAAVELTKDWRTDRVLRHLEALMIAVSKIIR